MLVNCTSTAGIVTTSGDEQTGHVSSSSELRYTVRTHVAQ
jgi:hypothetical protein